MTSRQMGKTKLEICAKLGVSTETFDALIDYINNENKIRVESKCKNYSSKKAVKEAYEKGYHEGFGDACDLIPTYLTEFIGNLISTLKESAKEAKCEVFGVEVKE